MKIKSLIALLLCSQLLFAQSNDRHLCILDMQEINSESNDARLFSLEQMANVAGIPFTITKNIEEAIQFPILFLSSELKNATFDNAEVETFEAYVEEGGVLIAPRVEAADFFDLFGITEITSSKNRYSVHWQVDEAPELFRWINEPEEKTISLGRENQGDIYKTIGYQVQEGTDVLGIYDDANGSWVRTRRGLGTAYAFGFSIKEVICRNQINRDYEAQRISSNGFEPTQDVFFFLLRNIYNEHIPFGVWKHTSPYNSTSSLLVTHDIDSRTGMDSLSYFVDDEQARGVVATYNLTVRYFEDDIMSAFYDYGKDNAIPRILNGGHKLGSHSVGHFFDFADEDIFPVGEAGNTQDNYLPYNDGDVTVGGTIYGECEVSLNTIEEDSGEDIRIFRAGHLAYHKYLINVLAELGYDYCTNYSAADVLTNFPYYTKMGRSFSGERTSIIEIPVTISDVFHSDPISAQNINQKVNTWLDVLGKNDDNGANTCLLIHPNRMYKAEGQESFLEQIPDGVIVKEMADYGDYWRVRSEAAFDSELENNVLTISINTASYANDEQLSFVVAKGQALEDIVVKDENGNTLDLERSDWEEEDVILHHPAPVVSGWTIKEKSENKVNVFPNPSQNGFINLRFCDSVKNDGELKVFDINGVLRMTTPMQINPENQSMILDVGLLNAGIYFLSWSDDQDWQTTKFVKK